MLRYATLSRGERYGLQWGYLLSREGGWDCFILIIFGAGLCMGQLSYFYLCVDMRLGMGYNLFVINSGKLLAGAYMKMFITLVKRSYGFTNKSFSEPGAKTYHNDNDVPADAAGDPASAITGT
jgi:hypothetical protein